MGRRQRRNLARNAANACWKKTSDSAEIPGTNLITSNSKADISIVTNLASPSAAIESQGDGKLESEMEVKEDSYEGNGDISDERQDDGNMDGEENEDDGDVSQGDESCDTDDDISEDDSHIGDPDYVPPVEIRIDEADSPDSNGLFVGELSQLHEFVSSINSNSACMTPGCKGKLVCTALKRSGLGGAVDMSFTCDGCDNRKTTFQSSTRYKPPSGRSN